MFEESKLFIQFGLSHVLVIVTTALLVLVVYKTKNWHVKHVDLLSKVISTLGVLFFPIHFIVYKFVINTFDIRYDLPILQVCGIITASVCVYLITKKEIFYKIICFWGISAMLASFFTPALLEDFPHIYFWLFWVSHWVIVYVISFIIFVLPKNIKYIDIWKSTAALAIYAFIIYFFDIFTHSNYGFMIDKPAGIQFTTLFGIDFNKSPYYLIPATLIVIILFHLIYVIFNFKNLKKTLFRLNISVKI